jgi:polyferredoxin
MESTPKKKSLFSAARVARWRWWIQGGFLLFWLDPLSLRMHNVCGPVFHCYGCPMAAFACPIGVLANFSSWHVISFAPIGMFLVIGAIFGSFVCGWACPFGFLQDLLHKIPTPKFRLPSWLSAFRYFTLVGLVFAVSYFYGQQHDLFFCKLCPAGALEGAVPSVIQSAWNGNDIVWPSAIKISILLVVIGVSLFTWRPWCMLLCPLGAIYSLFDPISVFFLRFRKTQCIECVNCRGKCRDQAESEYTVDGLRCVRCLDCSNCRAISLQTAFTRPANPSEKPLVELEQPQK